MPSSSNFHETVVLIERKSGFTFSSTSKVSPGGAIFGSIFATMRK